ncbi:hypothetical protein AMTR_s00086p00175620 [Amborella trichopoda]|uniref:RING-type domain-containing protein n=1 Tax=Amborella trichopoda TaxID=13333 RepID=W1P5I0_AMBTC|nr:hypothetical protein AMTR_s00086p00175620 [Amborella trichopoda]
MNNPFSISIVQVHLQVHQLLVTMDSFRADSFLSGFCTVELESSRVRLRSPIVDPQAPIQGNIIIQINLSEHVSFTSLLAPQQHKKRITIITFSQRLNTRSITYHFLKDEFHRMDVPYQVINHVINHITDKFWEILEVTNREGMAPQEALLVKLSMEIVREVDDAVQVEASFLAEDFVSRPAAGHAVESLERVDMKKDEEIICTICMCEMDFGTVDVRAMPCSHRYHGECIATWQANRSSCPVCRYRLPTAN